MEENVDSRYGLEVHVLNADRRLRDRQRVAHLQQLEHFRAQHKCCEELAGHAAQTLKQLAAASSVCERMQRETAPLLSESESRVLRQREEAALEDALNQQLKPLREARAVANQLDAGFDDAPAYSTDHPVVAALRTLDLSGQRLTESAHWRESSKCVAPSCHTTTNPRCPSLQCLVWLVSRTATLPSSHRYALELTTLRCQVLRLASAHITRPITALLAQLLSEQRAAAATAAAAGGGGTLEQKSEPESKVQEEAHDGVAAPETAASVACEEAPYERFQSIAAQLRPWAAEVEARASGSSSCYDVLSDAQQSYWAARHALIKERLRTRLEAQLRPSAGRGATDVTADEQLRRCCGEGLRTCAAEHALYSSLFSLAGSLGTRSRPMLHAQLESLTSPLYDVLRPLVLKQTALEPLCEMVQVMQDEVLADGVRASPACAPLKTMLKRLLQDLQERILFRFQAYLRDEVRAFRPAPHDLDFPARFTADTPHGGKGWYPTLQRSVSCMAQVYRCLPNGVFEGLAQEAVSDCTASLLRAAALLPRQQPLDGMLFKISHLLALREQIAPFDVDFVTTQKALDFSHSRAMLGMLGARRRSVGAAHAVAELLKQGAPSLVESHTNAKQRLEMHLKESCEDFILHCTNLAVLPLLPLLPHPAAPTLGGATAATPRGGAAQPHNAAPPRLEAEALRAALDAVDSSLRDSLEPAHELTRRYLPEPATQAILFSPIRTNVLEALGQLQTLLNGLEMNEAQRAQLDAERRLAALASRLEDITSGIASGITSGTTSGITAPAPPSAGAPAAATTTSAVAK